MDFNYRPILRMMTLTLTGLLLWGGLGAASRPQRVRGVDYGPFRPGQQPGGPCPTLRDIRLDMPLLKTMANAVRIYDITDCDLGDKVLTAAEPWKLPLVLGIWIDGNAATNEAGIAQLADLAKRGLPGVQGVVVGSEALLRGEVTPEQLIAYINRVQAIVPDLPVTTAEPWHIWLDRPDLADAVDVVFVNIFPYWENQCADQAVDYVFSRFDQVRSTYPNQPVLISETGWPTSGAHRGCAVPSLANQRLFLEEFLCRVDQERVNFFYFSAFDEPWKAPPEVEAHWGFYDANRQARHAFTTLKTCPVK